MANEELNASRAANRDVPKAPPGPFQDCSDEVRIALFFDGTGNNDEADTDKKKWSNVARIRQSVNAFVRLNGNQTVYPIYLAGVGTKFNGEATGWIDSGMVWAQDKVGGLAVGSGGDRRLAAGQDNVNKRLRDVLIANANRLGGELQAYADKNKEKSFADVNNALGKHRLIKVIDISIFGFSRGAALARAFANNLIAQCVETADGLTFQGYPLRLSFVGLFDTVASFGVPAANARTPWSERELLVPSQAERCVHFVAAHELRAAFPVDLIRKNGQLSGNWLEKVYPGVHSDVGGGYEPVNQGISNNYARIPMRDMMREAILCGVRLLSYAQLANDPRYKAIFQERFECKPETENLYRSYMAACGGGGSVEQQVQQHMKLLYSAYGSMNRAGEKTAGERQRSEKLFGPRGMAWEVNKYRGAVALGQKVRLSDKHNLYAQYLKPENWQIAAWDSPAKPSVVHFVQDFVHDSKVDFVGNIEPFSYFRPRGIQESTKNVWHEAGDWIGAKAQTVGAAAESAYDATATKVGETADAAAAAAKKAVDATAAAATKAYDATSAAAARAAEAAKRQAAETAQDGKRIFENGVQWFEQTGKELGNKVQGLLR